MDPSGHYHRKSLVRDFRIRFCSLTCHFRTLKTTQELNLTQLFSFAFRFLSAQSLPFRSRTRFVSSAFLLASLPLSCGSSASLRLPSASASFFYSGFLGSSPRPISISKLPCYHAFTAVLSTLSSSRGLTSLRYGSLLLEVGFTLRCLQRLSHPYFASLLCRWHDNSCTSGTSIPVLSY